MQKKDVIDYIESNKKIFTDISDNIWDVPELKFDLPKSSKILIDAFKREGFYVQEGVANMKYAFVATYGNEGNTIGFLGEYDALPNLSQVADKPEKSCILEDANGHGCGHNALGSGTLAAAFATKKYIKDNNIKATIKYFGCPAEESGYGKVYMARDGIFDNVDIFITWHPMTENKAWEERSLAVFQATFEFTGVSSHAAKAPENGKSALDSAELMNIGVNYLREHIPSDARIHYAYLNSGGEAANVVQASSKILYYIRAPKMSVAKNIFDRVVNIAKGACLMSDTTMNYKLINVCRDCIPNEVLLKIMHKNMELVGEIIYTDDEINYAQKFRNTLDEDIKKEADDIIKEVFYNLPEDEIKNILKNPMTTKLFPLDLSKRIWYASTDVGDVSYIAPTVQLMSASYPRGTAIHMWQCTAIGKSSIFHKAMLYAAKSMALTAIDLIENKEYIQEAKDLLKKQLGNEKYFPYISSDSMPEI